MSNPAADLPLGVSWYCKVDVCGLDAETRAAASVTLDRMMAAAAKIAEAVRFMPSPNGELVGGQDVIVVTMESPDDDLGSRAGGDWAVVEIHDFASVVVVPQPGRFLAVEWDFQGLTIKIDESLTVTFVKCS